MSTINILSLSLTVTIGSIVSSISLDSHHETRDIKKIGFGACNNLRYPFDYFQNIIDTEPDVWIWTGDIVYGRTRHGTDLTNIRNNYQKVKSHRLYQQFLSNNVIVDGVYDDHDIGANDADNRLSKPIQKEAQKLLLDFLNIDKNDSRRQRDGAYSVHKFDDIMIIILDTRTHRSPTVIPSIGKWEFPFFAFIASYIRYLTTYFGFVNNYKGTVLGEEQWNWFQQILQSKEFKTSNLVLIVSSTQILTGNPYFESWGHFPSEKIKLLKLLRDNVMMDDQHILFLSGDVHHAELLYGNHEYGPLEVTSSGLTHSLGTMSRLFGLQKFLALHITDVYGPYHRTKYPNPEIKTVFYGRNFGVIEKIEKKKYRLNIYDSLTGKRVISIPLNNDKNSSFDAVLKEMNDESRIYFPHKYPFYGLEIIGPAIALIVGIVVLYKLLTNCKDKQQRDKKEL